jgi:uncharacterized protein
MRAILWLVALICFSGATLGQSSRATGRILAGPEGGTYLWFGQDLAKWVAAPAGINLQVLSTKGSVENVRRFSEEKDISLALITSDVLQAYSEQAEKGNRQAAQMVRPLRVMLPLYDAELHFVVRKDSPLRWVHEIQNKKINIGLLGSGDASTSSMVYQALFNTPLLEANVSTQPYVQALQRMLDDNSIDVVTFIHGQPSPLLLGLEPSVEKNFRLLQLDESHPSTQSAARVYTTGVIKASSYPNWLTQDMATFTVKSYLVTREPNMPAHQKFVARFAKSLCSQFASLQQNGHPKWRQVSLELPPLRPGWQYHEPTEKQLRHCSTRLTTLPAKAASPVCTLVDKAMGLCGSGARN